MNAVRCWGVVRGEWGNGVGLWGPMARGVGGDGPWARLRCRRVLDGPNDRRVLAAPTRPFHARLPLVTAHTGQRKTPPLLTGFNHFAEVVEITGPYPRPTTAWPRLSLRPASSPAGPFHPRSAPPTRHSWPRLRRPFRPSVHP